MVIGILLALVISPAPFAAGKADFTNPQGVRNAIKNRGGLLRFLSPAKPEQARSGIVILDEKPACAFMADPGILLRHSPHPPTDPRIVRGPSEKAQDSDPGIFLDRNWKECAAKARKFVHTP